MNTAILLHGVLHRSLRYTKDSLVENLVKPLEEFGAADIYYHSWDPDEIYNPRGNELHIKINRDDIHKYLPSAKGIIEAQQEFDNSINYLSFDSTKNPMMQCSKDMSAAMVATINYVRDAESQLRAFNYFVSHKDKQYQLVIVARPDVRYLNKLNISNAVIAEDQIVVPAFHSWWGVNDRFAMGLEKTIGTYCYRRDAAQQWLINGNHYNSEIFLKKYLEKHNIRIKVINFTFQRVRADGKVCPLDENL